MMGQGFFYRNNKLCFWFVRFIIYYINILFVFFYLRGQKVGQQGERGRGKGLASSQKKIVTMGQN